MPMRCYFLTCQVTIKFWPVYKSRSIFWTDFEDLKGRLIHGKIRYIPDVNISYVIRVVAECVVMHQSHCSEP